MTRLHKWSLELIVLWWGRTCPKMTLTKAMDIFADSVENYKNCDYKQKLFYVAQSFILAANIARIDFLTGAQAFEVADNLATDFGADKNKVQNQINYIMHQMERKYDDKRYDY